VRSSFVAARALVSEESPRARFSEEPLAAAMQAWELSWPVPAAS
jgi:hypothetical protein